MPLVDEFVDGNHKQSNFWSVRTINYSGLCRIVESWFEMNGQFVRARCFSSASLYHQGSSCLTTYMRHKHVTRGQLGLHLCLSWVYIRDKAASMYCANEIFAVTSGHVRVYTTKDVWSQSQITLPSGFRECVWVVVNTWCALYIPYSLLLFTFIRCPSQAWFT